MTTTPFYETQAKNAIPLILMSEIQFKEAQESLSLVERNIFANQQFSGSLGAICLMHNQDGLLAKVYVGSGVGDQGQALANAALGLPAASYVAQEPLSQVAILYWSLAQYRYTEYKKQDWQPRRLVVTEQDCLAAVVDYKAVFLVRDLINRPTNDLGPEQLEQVVVKLAKSHGAEFKSWVGEELVAANFPAIYTVGRASAQAPRLLSLTWGNPSHPRVTLIGKGVCFDSGGLDIKPSAAMRYMKKDMGGAAHVIGLAQWIMSRGLAVHLQVLIPAVENSVGPDAFRPGDIITMRNGLTVEVDNTDAEGRLVLADALVKACEEKPALVFDFATLTGAARVAVGTEIAAMFCNDDQLAQALADASKAVEDPLWRLPLHAGYEPLLDSSVADLANSGASPYAGAISAALFLQRFVPKSLPWVHFDIMAWNLSTKPGKPEGGEAMALRAVADYLLKTYGIVN